MKDKVKEMGNHIVKGITNVIPFIVLYSIVLALRTGGVILSNESIVPDVVYFVIIPILTAGIANSISSKITIVPGLVLGYYVDQFGLGFFGGILGGLLLGYLLRCICKKVYIKNSTIMVLVGYIVLGVVGFFVSYFAMKYLAKDGILFVLDGIRSYIEGVEASRTVFLVVLLTVLTVIDLGGPFNKLAYSFILAFYLDGFYHITGPVMISVSLAPLTVFIGLLLFKNNFNEVDHKNKYFALFGGIFGMTEGAMAIGFRRPLVIIPPLVIGSVFATIFASINHIENPLLLTSVLGLFGVNNILFYILSYVIGIVVTLGIWFIMFNRKRVAKS